MHAQVPSNGTVPGRSAPLAYLVVSFSSSRRACRQRRTRNLSRGCHACKANPVEKLQMVLQDFQHREDSDRIDCPIRVDHTDFFKCEHSCRWMKDKSGGKSSATLYLQAGMCKTKRSLATVCSTACNEKTTKRLGNSLSGGTAKEAKS
jgi:hypothetical protein